MRHIISLHKPIVLIQVFLARSALDYLGIFFPNDEHHVSFTRNWFSGVMYT